ncbi:MFS transporter [Candidatus Desulfosporosinus nitrosoreducens]|uniref:MFS transporter n=1 Tax=Candidatus Desulfosporosinus nitrosoreducens TaxID=3401928 RepID=UPI00280AB3BC|nr:MFS transporter [Desulfosporosinus sp. PR]
MYFRFLKNKDFILYIIGSTVTFIGDEMLIFSLALYMLKLTGLASTYATVVAIGALPPLILGPIAGSIVDIFNKKMIVIGLDLLRGILLITMALKTLLWQASVVDIYVIVLAIAVCDSFYIPAHASIIPSILEDNELNTGNTVNSITTQVSMIIAPTIAALTYGLFGIWLIFLIDAITFLIVVVSMIFVKLKPGVKIKSKSGFLSKIIEGFKMYKDKEILSISLNGMFTHMLVLPIFIIGFPYLIKDVFEGADLTFAAVQTVGSLGPLLTIITVPLVGKFYKELKALNLCMVGMLLSIATIFLLRNTALFTVLKGNNTWILAFFAPVIFLFEACLSTYLVFYTSFNQRKVDPQLLGRFYSLLIMLFGLGRIIGSKLYGALFDLNIIFYPVMAACIGIVFKLLLNLMITPNKSLARALKE